MTEAQIFHGKVLWYDRRDGRGIVVDAYGNEYYVDSSVLLSLQWLNAKDEVTFKVRELGGVCCAFDVDLLPGGQHTDCGSSECQECCPHDERDHGICLDCGDEEDPGEAIDRAMDALEDR